MMPGERAPARGAPQPATGRVRRKAAGSARARTALDWNKHATQETRSFGQAGRGVPSPSGSRHTGNWKDSLENSQTGVTALPGGRGSPPPTEKSTSGCFFSDWSGQTQRNTPLAQGARGACRVAGKAEEPPAADPGGAPRGPAHRAPLCTFSSAGLSPPSARQEGGWPPAGPPIPAADPRPRNPAHGSKVPRQGPGAVSVSVSLASSLGFAGQREPNSGRRNSH